MTGGRTSHLAGLLAALAVALSGRTAPFSGRVFSFRQPDGQTIVLRGWGDEHAARFETVDGFTVVRDPISRAWCYAVLTVGGQELDSTGVPVDTENPSLLGLSRGLWPLPAATRGAAATPRRELQGLCRWEERRAEARDELVRALREGRGGGDRAPPTHETVGRYTGLCVLVDFPDDRVKIPRDDVDDLFSKRGYKGFGNHGSVADYFEAVSNGRLEIRAEVTDYYTAKHPKAYYQDPAIPYPQRAKERSRLLTVAWHDSMVARGSVWASRGRARPQRSHDPSYGCNPRHGSSGCRAAPQTRSRAGRRFREFTDGARDGARP